MKAFICRFEPSKQIRSHDYTVRLVLTHVRRSYLAIHNHLSHPAHMRIAVGS